MSKELGILIKEARAKKGLTQAALAAAVDGLTAAEVGKAERGESEPSEAEVRAIAKALGVTQKSLVDAMSKNLAKADSGSASKKTSSAKTTSSSKTSSSNKASGSTSGKASSTKKTSGGSSTAKTSSGTDMKLTSAEKELITFYRKADDKTKMLVKTLLTGEAPKSEDLVGSLLGSALGKFSGR